MNAAQQDFDLYSDLYKDVHGFRPRGHSEDFMSLTPEARSVEIEALAYEIREEIERETQEREAFRAKVASLGLNPDKYMHLFQDPF